MSDYGKHWSDEQLIGHVYGVGPEEEHLLSCAECRDRLNAMQASRRQVESSCRLEEAVDAEMLVAQRRAIYQRLDKQAAHPFWQASRRAWASAALTVILLGGGATAVREWQHSPTPPSREINKMSDAELADQVSQIADNAEPQPAAPLEALFEE